ncbi:MAG: N-acetylmuramoyl-L-alanine amidase [Blastomonas sp.]
MFALTSLCASMLCLAPASAGEVSRVEVRDSEVTVYFDDVVSAASSFSLTGPDRIAVDVVGATSLPRLVPERGLVQTVRFGQFEPDTARIVLDLERPAVVTSGAFAHDGRSLKLSITELASPEWQKAVGAGRKQFLPPAEFRASPPKQRYSVRVQLPPPSDAIKLPKIYGPDDNSRPLVVIDAGHGGHDPGAISPHNGKREKDVTLAIARAIRDELVASGRVRVALTREDDKFLVLQERYGIARRMGADLFISVHADAAGSADARGATIYTLSEVASDREASRLAARENKADIINGVNLAGSPDDVSSILIDLTQRETMNLSSDFARLLRREGAEKISFRSTSHRFASFVVLKAPDVPSVLLETGYLTNSQDVDFLASRSGQKRIAQSVANAVTVFFARKLAMR